MAEQPLGTHFNPRLRLETDMRTDGNVVLSDYRSSAPSMIGAIRVTRARNSNFWERHDHGDEVLVLLSGACTMTLRDAEGRTTERPMSPGDVLVIPKGMAHHGTLHTDEVQVLFVTPRTGTKEWSEGDATAEVGR
jgi:mannose-6-phosphate isomerase-like protein (cupin superfamily)